MKAPSPPYFCETRGGVVVRSDVRQHDKQVLVVAHHEDALIKLMPVDDEKELAHWFWTYVEEFGGEK